MKLFKTDELDIEWILNDDDSFNELNTHHFINRLKEVNRLPINKVNILFSDDVWNLSQMSTLNVAKSRKTFHFSGVNEVYKEELKSYVIIKLLENKNKLQTIRSKKQELDLFFQFLYEQNVFSIKDTNSSHIEKYLNTRSSNARSTQRNSKSFILDFYKYYSSNFEDIFTTEIKNILKHDDFKAYKAYKNSSKTSNIPEQFFSNLIKLLLKCIKSEEKELELRSVACIILLESQTGLRTGELLTIRENGLKSTKLFNGEIGYYVEYETWKREKGNNKKTIERTNINELSKLAFNYLLELHSHSRKEKKSDYLYCPINKKTLPVDPEEFSKHAVGFFIYHGKELDIVDNKDKYPDLQTAQIKGRPYSNMYPHAKTISYPNNTQFRVHVCTDLYKQGVPLEYIKKFMGHLSSQMEGYYVRPAENQIQEDIDFSKKVIEDIVSGNAKLLGSNSKALTSKIDEFIVKGNFNVAKDIHEIAATLSESIPIRAKTGGVCIKSSPLRDCRKDVMTNELFCTYNVCPNIFHFFYMANISYRQCKELTETIALNEKRGHLKQAQKETNMLVQTARSKLFPELEELGKEIQKKGAEYIILEYPDLTEIATNFDDIFKEAKLWTRLNKTS